MANHFINKFQKDILGIVYLSSGVFLSVALATFNPNDPSFNALSAGFDATNACGLIGSFTSDLFYQMFGLVAWVFPMVFFLKAVNTFNGKASPWWSPRTLWSLLLILTICSLAATYWPEKNFFQSKIFSGGVFGLMLSTGLVKALNTTGVQILLWSLTLVFLVFFSEKTLFEISFYLRTKIFRPGFRLIFIGKRNLTGLRSLLRSEATSRQEHQGSPLEATGNIPTSLPPVFEFDLNSESPRAIEPGEKRRVTIKAKTPRRIENWEMPKIALLEDPPASRVKIDDREIKRKAELLTDKLRNFSIEGQIVDAKPGPLVTLYEFKPNADVKISKISELEDDLSLALSSESVRVVGHIPGRDVVGIETSNLKRETVFYKDLVAEDAFWSEDFSLPMALGRAVNGEPKIVDLRKMPHLLIAGTTGSGKSVFVSSIITGLLFKHSPKTLRLILIDPKMVDLAHFSKIPHLVLPHITEAKKATLSLRWAVREMEKRYRSLSKFGVSKIEHFNEKASRLTAEEIEQHEVFNQEIEQSGKGKGDQYYFRHLPYIVIIVDELADLMVTEKQNIEQPIQRLTQMARACGMHLILATQSPRKDVVTGLIKTNIPGRIGLKVASKMDSRIILDDSGAERLLPNGDMLFLAPGVAKPMRHHGPFLSDAEISAVVNFWAQQGEPDFDLGGIKVLEGTGVPEGDSDGVSLTSEGDEEDFDEMYDHILAWTAEQKEVSASLLQRKFRLGYPRAARLIEVFEREGIVGPANGSKPRQVLDSVRKAGLLEG